MNDSVTIVFNRKKNATTETASSVEIRIIRNRKSYYFATGIKCKINEFKNGKVVKKLDACSCNETISALADKVRSIVATMRTISIEEIRKQIEHNDRKPDFCLWLQERLNERNMRESTRKQHLVAIKCFIDSGIFSSWDDITAAKIKRWDEQLHKSGISQVTVHSYHKRIKPYLNDAVLFGYIEKNPYDYIRIPLGKSKRISYLTAEELKAVEDCQTPSVSLEHVKDCFLFQCYTGMAYADASSLTKESFVVSNGSLYIISTRQKCECDIVIKVIAKALKIVEKYDYELPWISLTKYNLFLKALAQHSGINKQLTSHMGRHTFATQALHKGVPIEVVSKMLSHSDINTTQIYAKVLAEDIKKGFDMIDE